MKKLKSLRVDEAKWEQLGVIANSMRFTRGEFIETMVDLIQGAEEKPFAQLVEQNLLEVISAKLQSGALQRAAKKK